MKFFKIKERNQYYVYKFLGITFYKKKKFLGDIKAEFKKNKSFNCLEFDKKIADVVDCTFAKKNFQKNTINPNRIAFLATEFGDMGGHTECVRSLTQLLSEKYEIKTFLTKINRSYQSAPTKMALIAKNSQIWGINQDSETNLPKKLKDLFDEINRFSPKVIFVFMHMDDCLACALLYILHKNTDIKIIYNNHGSHWPALGFLFADAVTFQLPATQWVNQNYRGIDKGINLNLSDDRKKDIINLGREEIMKIRHKLNIADDEFFSLSGASSYKFFDNNHSPYFEMIKDLLAKEPKLKHVVITKLSQEEKKIVNHIFYKSPERKRLKFINFTPEYSRIFQSCDVFIDSFPIGSALTHVELMKHKKVSVVKINSENALFSFHEFFPKDYPYMFTSVEKMEEAILYLLHNKKEIRKTGQKLWQHFLTTFEGNYVKNQHIRIIENAQNLEKFFVHINDNAPYEVKIEK